MHRFHLNNFFLFREGDLRVIRPLVHVREKELRNFAEKVSEHVLKFASVVLLRKVLSTNAFI